MANNKMLIDASHPEETRVVVLRGNRIEEFDFESASKKPLRGNIYLAKVTRVEPSLQAAFVEYGGNRHGFLAFSEIHPDYYQIPVADRQALLEAEALERRDEEEEEERRRTRPPQQQGQQRRNRRFRGRNGDRNAQRAMQGDEVIAADAPQPAFGEATESSSNDFPSAVESSTEVSTGTHYDNAPATSEHAAGQEAPTLATSSDAQVSEPAATSTAENAAEPPAETTPAVEEVEHAQAVAAQPTDFPVAEGSDTHEGGETFARAPSEDNDADEGEEDNDDSEEEEETVEQLGGDDVEEMARPARRTRRQYKIQEVIKRRQVLLVQVVKEERGNKGAALTTYLSLAGRYSVLMPNTARGGGISRKITDSDDRKRLREIAGALDVPEGMGVILRTAGAARGKDEVQRDFEYLLRMWESVRELTLRSMAPALVYEEGSLIKRSIRDLYGKEIDEVIVSGQEGYKEARDFMGMLMPSHVNNVRDWREPQPVFAKYGVEQQLDSMFSNVVTLKSGGYIVVNQTEALVAIDVNSGRSTREHNIEDTALRTNLEAADEVARQLRLRDLAGLIVVDFIDMEEYRNNRSVERRMKEALKSDRARIQVGRISHFGLLEMSRQRMRTGVLEGSSVPCPHCMGAGTVRSTASIALHVLRLMEDALIRNNQFNLTVRTRTEVALYILNQKRAHLREIEERFGVTVIVSADDTLSGTNYHALERGEPVLAPVQIQRPQQIRVDTIAPLYEDDDTSADTTADDADEAEGDESEEETTAEGAAGDAERSRRRRRRRRGGRNRESSGIEADAPQPSDEALAAMAAYANQPAVPREGGELAPASDIEAAPEGEAQETGEAGGYDRNRRNGRRRRGGRGRDGEVRPRFGNGEEGAENGAAQTGSWVRTPESQEGDVAPSSQQPSGAWAPAALDQPSMFQPSMFTPPAGEPAAVEPSPPVQEPAAPVVSEPAAEPMASAPVQPRQPDIAAAPEPAADEKPVERRPVEVLPEAPPPPEKKGGWWQRARNAMSGG